MRRTRVIPVLLIHKGGVYKTTKFSKPVYIGDPINAIRLFNDMEVDECGGKEKNAKSDQGGMGVSGRSGYGVVDDSL